MLQIVKQPENGGAGYVLVAVMDGDPGKWMTLVCLLYTSPSPRD